MPRSIALVVLIALTACNRPGANAPAGIATDTASPAPETASVPTMVAPVDPPSAGAKNAAVPAEVAALAQRIEACEHFAGEEPYDAARAKVLREAVARNCTGNAATLQALRKKYAADPAIAETLGRMEAPEM